MNLHRDHFPVVSGGFRFWFWSPEIVMDRKPRFLETETGNIRIPFRFRFPFRFAWVSNGNNHHYVTNPKYWHCVRVTV